jgi:nucleotide-binding universal stress UspA family protein
MLKRILVGLGGTEYSVAAIDQAVSLALAHQAELTGVSVIDEARLTAVGPVPLGGGEYARELAMDRMAKAAERVEWAIGKFTEACQSTGVKFRVLREVAEPFTALTEQARYHDLMVFGLRSLFEFDLVDDPHDALIRLVQAGVRPLIAVSLGFKPVHKALIAYSGSMESAKAMKHFVQMRLWPQAQVRIVSFADGRAGTEQFLADAAEYCSAHGLQVETCAVSGSAKDQLLPYAEQWGADITVIGNSAKNLLLRRIFGETALQAIRHANRPLFLAQ